MTDVELLPLPEHLLTLIGEYGCSKSDGCSDVEHLHRWEQVLAATKDYARANVAHTTAAQAAEIEALRAEIETWKTYARGKDGLWQESVRRAERLAEAVEGLADEWEDNGWPDPAKQLRALLREQEEGK